MRLGDFDVERFVAALKRRGARFDWLQAPDFDHFYLNLHGVDIDAVEEVSIRYALFDHYDEVRAVLLSRDVRH
jgi:hypothetical protein